ncbi:MAG: DUF1385 domain-containing protein [Acidobacteria bacterium]|nr:MAG: DUF1385 domain-containing protein [Acidobacteriota bacterium]
MSFRSYLRFHTALQLSVALESPEETLVGGQAVLEGVMMRAPHAWGIAIRRPDGGLATHSEPLAKPSDKSPWKAWPFIRGIITLGSAMMLGFKALRYSADVAMEDEKTASGEKLEMNGWVVALNIAISLVFFIFMYKFLPFAAARSLRQWAPQTGNSVFFALVEGLIRLAIFLGFLWLTSRWKDMQRVYEYHGAEHKTVFAFENHDPLTAEAVQRYSTLHPRCGTSFLMTVMVISIAIYALVPVHGFWAGFGSRILLLPVIAGSSYEIIRFAAKRRSSLFALMTAPGLWLQRITTRQPDDSQVECAIVALNHAMELERQQGGELVIS